MQNIIPTQDQKVKEKLNKLEKQNKKIFLSFIRGGGSLKSYVYIK